MMLPSDYTSTKNIFEEKDLEINILKEEVKKLTIERNILLQVK